MDSNEIKNKMKRIYLLFTLILSALCSRAQSLTVQDVEASVGEEAELVVTLADGTEMSALQFNLTLPEGVTFDATRVQLGDATDDHTLCIEPLASGSHLFVLYSEDQKTFADDELLRIPLSAGSEALTAEGQLTKVRTATVDAVSHTCADVPFNAEWRLRAFSLADDADNSTLLATWDGQEADVTLSGRTLYKDNEWNTLCLPFDLTLAGSPLQDAAVKTLGSSTFQDGTLTLNFVEANSIESGKPYIVKWAGGDHLVNPVFAKVTVGGALTDVVTDVVTFCGTYNPVSFDTENHRVLILGEGSALFHPDGLGHSYVNAFRAYFQLADGYTAGDADSNVKAIILNIDGEATALTEIQSTENKELKSGVYDLQGRRVNTPTKGLYILNGKKVHVK